MAQRHYWGLYLDPKDAEKQHLKIFLGAPSEIVTPLTPGKSQGTKIFGSKFFSYHENKMLFYEDFGFMWLKLKFYAKNHLNLTVFAIT